MAEARSRWKTLASTMAGCRRRKKVPTGVGVDPYRDHNLMCLKCLFEDKGARMSEEDFDVNDYVLSLSSFFTLCVLCFPKVSSFPLPPPCP
ncbi:hypothetical protein RIF29_17751 [Crotalaria pallida]|uniref:Uncharacterized protein n=1 Tax=Crotalaria pallida TaxID=3830 RepID=A0AAN9ID91_CROPI